MENHIINSNKGVYYIIYEDKKLILLSNESENIINQNITKYSVKYYDEYIYIIYLKDKTSIYVYKFNIINNFSQEDRIIINNIEEIIEMNLEIRLSELHVIFIITNNDKLTIFDLVIDEECYLNKIEDVRCPKYIQCISSILINNSILFLICNNYEQSLYSLYIYNNGVYDNINSFILKDSLNIFILNIEGNIGIFYNRIEEKKMSLLYRQINVNAVLNYRIAKLLNYYERNKDRNNLIEEREQKNKIKTQSDIPRKNFIKNYNNIAIDYKFLIKDYLNEEKIKKIEKSKSDAIEELKDKIKKIQLEKSNILIRDMNKINNLIEIINEKDKIIEELLNSKL